MGAEGEGRKEGSGEAEQEAGEVAAQGEEGDDAEGSLEQESEVQEQESEVQEQESGVKESEVTIIVTADGKEVCLVLTSLSSLPCLSHYLLPCRSLRVTMKNRC